MLFKEKGYQPIIKIGEVQVDDFRFDHSWIEFVALLIDVSIVNTILKDVKLPSVMLGYGASAGESYTYQYGIIKRLDSVIQIIFEQSIGDYVMKGVEHQLLFVM